MVGAEPNPVVRVAAFFRALRFVVPWSTFRRGPNVGCNAGVAHTFLTLPGANGRAPAFRAEVTDPLGEEEFVLFPEVVTRAPFRFGGSSSCGVRSSSSRVGVGRTG